MSTMSLSKNITHCRRCVTLTPRRQLNSGSSNTVELIRMQAKNMILNQWKFLNQLKQHISKVTTDKTFENALNKEFAHFLQKIEPKTYGKSFVRYLGVTTTPDDNKNIEKQETDGSSLLPSVLNGLKISVRRREEVKPIPKWKTEKPLISKESIVNRTSQILASVLQAETDHFKLSHIEDLISHLKSFPEAKHNAVKEGAIRLLLRLREKTRNSDLQAAINEAFGLLGYTDPVKGNGIRILSIDGGGTRGILVIEMLRKLEEFSGKHIYEMFDLICGVSTGAIIGTIVGLKNSTLDEASSIYKSISTQIFTQSALRGTSNLVWSHSYYDTDLWEELLQAQWGDKELVETRRNPKCPKFCAVSAVVNQSSLSAYLFRNYSLPCKVQSNYLGSPNHRVWEAVRASAAAPTYFEEFKTGNMLHQDGGVLVNNPTAIAIHEAKLLWPDTPIECVISFGTGRTAPTPVDPGVESTPIYNSSWKNKFLAIINSATDTEGVHTMLTDLLPSHVYFRFNPYLTEMMDMAEINPKKIEQLERDALMYLRRNEDKFQEAVRALCKPKSISQKALDWMNLQKEIHGFKQE